MLSEIEDKLFPIRNHSEESTEGVVSLSKFSCNKLVPVQLTIRVEKRGRVKNPLVANETKGPYCRGNLRKI